MSEEPTEVSAPSCYRHAGRETYIRCQRCERPICPDCMHEASVGFQCPECVREGARTVRSARTPYGGRRTANPGVVTLSLIGLNALVWLLVTASGAMDGEVLPALALIPAGAFYLVGEQPTFVSGVADGAVYQLVTAMFTHVEIWHIGFNMLALYILGPQLEALLGRWRFLALYLLSGLAGSVAVYWLAGVHSITVGASGAIFGLMAALLIVAIRVKGEVQSLLTLVGINLAITVLGSGFISWQGHFGGFAGGLLLALALVYAPRRHRTLWQVGGLVLFGVLLLVAVALRTAMIA